MPKPLNYKHCFWKNLTEKQRKRRIRREIDRLAFSLRNTTPPDLVQEHYDSWKRERYRPVTTFEKSRHLGGRPLNLLTPNERRLMKELEDFVKYPIPGMIIDADSIADNLREWRIQLRGPPNSLFAGETFNLIFLLTENYPYGCPQVKFLGPNIPLHPQVYSDGNIRLPMSREEWTSGLPVEYICLFLSKMLRDCKEKKRPDDDPLRLRVEPRIR